MQSKSEPPRQAEGSGALVEPEVSPAEVESVPARWLHSCADPDQVDRIAADADLLVRLALHRFEGKEWNLFVRELAKYAMAVVSSWMRQGLMLHRCKQLGVGLPALGRDFTKDEIAGLVDETVALALQHFRNNVLMKGGWDQTGGASLRTFFIGQCLFQFANLYRSFWRSEQRSRDTVLSDDMGIFGVVNDADSDPDRRAVSMGQISDLLAKVKTRRLREAVVWRAAGHSHAGIAELLNCTEKTVERMLANERQRLRRSAG